MQLLHIDSSINGDQSISRQLSQYITDAWCRQHPNTQVDYLDLAKHAPNHFNAASMALRNPAMTAEGGVDVEAESARTEELLTQFLSADVLVIGAPFYNFTIPSQLKAWIDRILQPGRTFRYSSEGPIGLAGGKKVWVASSRGGIYSNPVGQDLEHQESYLRVVFRFMGIEDVQFIHAEGIGKGPEASDQALRTAKAKVDLLLGIEIH